jgi:hypothetical protein
MQYVDGVNRVYDVLEKMGILQKIKSALVSDIASGGMQGFFEGEDDLVTPEVWIAGKKFSLENLLFMTGEK